ncbi:hypothetical protein [Acetobacter orleanensis]|uniref:Uncharacterized protein n=1 Tax=Acetobacter orleanensis TaxID=104099 RepID=A0A4Y3TQ45_9PROT|nr:hypothetical protein [Acetobacter orleanensis]KXV66742.1 hypothetical protein AD949_01630 [Acetobacter orleanensis]PCD78776.1 hypothetical protein CO710_10600 [Acetobacter orleanensis]GAN69539.1 hypothetical protein Abol_043_021 [Acetobacter orleanensis JCM 7639]GBR23453.1 hypothetical protein AA0473_0382 [Acetobacter orleanensis NRIC 0473]GEB83908.1 hypothetical protein AOR01nite_23850 [Acetobacter orleanensis]
MEQTPGTPKALMAAVIGMGILIVVGTVGLVGVIIHRMGAHKPPIDAALSLPPVPLQTAATLPVLPPGARLMSMARVREGLMALHINEVGRDRILLWHVGSDHLIPGVESSNAPMDTPQ